MNSRVELRTGLCTLLRLLARTLLWSGSRHRSYGCRILLWQMVLIGKLNQSHIPSNRPREMDAHDLFI